MVKRIGFGDAPCPVARALDVIGDGWSLLIVRDAFDGVRRFSEFQASLGIAKGILASRLRDLTRNAILETAPASDGSAYREYVLTQKGRSLFLVVVALRQWGEDHLYRSGEARSSLVDVETNEPVPRLDLRTHAGLSLAPEMTRVKKVEETR
ncbi:helix-turn-helix domain-containing protein [Aureimonas sp. ME7]|uniref:winged helix-turn-helix transcriptional regulator n=1 Tax=Aureimonas sp. ME7 TaxID=2744252 RepID=UPI0015F35667|nr:helix-turn-helix domain-containing protein [Aureimonas sp. ME7]